MAIKKIHIENFKSFRDLTLELGDFNVLIGANASGKSNIVRAFEFLRDLSKLGLDNAVSLQGGISYLRNIEIGSKQALLIDVTSDTAKLGFSYRVQVKSNKTKTGFRLIEDRLILKGDFRAGLTSNEFRMEPGEFTLIHLNNKINIKTKGSAKEHEQGIIRVFQPSLEFLSNKEVLLRSPMIPLITGTKEVFGDISVYDFDPKLPKKPAPMAGKTELESDAGNLALVLRRIIEHPESKRKFSNLISDVLPFVKDLDIQKSADNLLFKLQETYFSEYLPAPLISDGTINLAALIVALYFDNSTTTVIEEPERNLHPHLLAKVVDMLKDASRNKQVIVSTHNPQIVKHAGLENILLVSRDKDGFSTVSRPKDNKELRHFLREKIGLDELYIRDLLGK